MSFLRRLLGGQGSGGPRPPSRAIDKDGHPDDVDATPERPPLERSPRSEPLKRPNLTARTYLEFIGGSASKFYAAVVEEDDDRGWRVWFNFGRIGFPRQWAEKVVAVDEAKARRVYGDLIGEKIRKGYELRTWPADLLLPDGEQIEGSADPPPHAVRGIYIADRPGRLPDGASEVAGISLPQGHRIAAEDEAGPRPDGPVIWVSDAPLKDVIERWAALERAFPATGLWPLVIDPSGGIDRLGAYLMNIPRSAGGDPFQLLRRWWRANTEGDGDEDADEDEVIRPFGRAFPGLAPRASGPRPTSIEHVVRQLEGHLGLVAVERPSQVLDTIGWMGPANYDLEPSEQSAILDTWEDRYDAYLVGLGSDTLTLAVGRPPQDLGEATAIAAEHFAFCPDNIWQGVGSLSEYAAMLVELDRWDFWWD